MLMLSAFAKRTDFAQVRVVQFRDQSEHFLFLSFKHKNTGDAFLMLCRLNEYLLHTNISYRRCIQLLNYSLAS